MRPINLLPEKHRARAPGAGASNGAYVVIGVLGGLLLMLVAFVLTTNQINSRKDGTTRAENEARQAEAKASSLQSFGDFSQVKEQRVQSVKQLAEVRFDWERLVRELAHVLPDHVYLTDLDAAAAPQQTTTAPAASGGVPGGPAVQLTGCARRQPDVAVTMLRLRRLHRAVDVKLAESTRADAGGASPATSAPSGSAPAAGGTQECRGYTFDATVSFTGSADAAARPGGENLEIPASLGGGS